MKIEIIKSCPSCNSSLVRVKDQLFCKNKSCPAKNNKQVENFAKITKIKGLGPKTIEKLQLQTISDIYTLAKDECIEKLGEKLGDKLYKEIEKSKNMELSTFLAGCSIPLIGKTAAEKIAVGINRPEDITKEHCKSVGLGEKATNNLINWLHNEYPILGIPINFSTKSTNFLISSTKYTICITGRIQGYTKAKIKEMLEEFNVKVVDNVSKNINFLICDNRKGSAKEKKAETLGIDILSFNEFMEMLNND